MQGFGGNAAELAALLGAVEHRDFQVALGQRLVLGHHESAHAQAQGRVLNSTLRAQLRAPGRADVHLLQTVQSGGAATIPLSALLFADSRVTNIRGVLNGAAVAVSLATDPDGSGRRVRAEIAVPARADTLPLTLELTYQVIAGDDRRMNIPVVAALWPAESAVRTSLVEALEYE